MLRQWMQSPVSLLLFRFLAFSGLLFAISLLPFSAGFLRRLVLFDARCSAAILSLAGEKVRLDGATFAGGRGITVVPGCSAIEFAWFFTAALLAFPAPPIKKAIGILAGTFAVLVLNLARISTLQLALVHFPDEFRFLHEDVWCILLVSAVLLLCLAWVRWVQRDSDALPGPVQNKV